MAATKAGALILSWSQLVRSRLPPATADAVSQPVWWGPASQARPAAVSVMPDWLRRKRRRPGDSRPSDPTRGEAPTSHHASSGSPA